MTQRWALGFVAAFGIAASSLGFSTVASAGGSLKDAPPPQRMCAFSANAAFTSDYVFRGFSQKQEDPTPQGGLDLSCGKFYVGVWGSGVDFVPGSGGANSGDAHLEVDWYGGVKHKFGAVEADLGFIYYSYPGANDAPNAELDYWEIKLALSTSIQKLGVSGTVYYSPEYTGEIGPVTTLEGGLSYTLAKMGQITPTISGLVGTSLFSDDGTQDYVYWNAGVDLAFGSNFSIDLRYWGTDNEGFCNTTLCDDRFVATAKIALP